MPTINPASILKDRTARDGADADLIRTDVPERHLDRSPGAQGHPPSEPVDAYRFGLSDGQGGRQESGFQSAPRQHQQRPPALQFVDSTWLTCVRQHGAKARDRQLADQGPATPLAVPMSPNGSAAEHWLEQGSTISAALPAKFAQDNKAEVERALGRPLRRPIFISRFPRAVRCHRLSRRSRRMARRRPQTSCRGASANRRGCFDGRTAKPRTVAESLSLTSPTKIEKNATPIRPRPHRARRKRAPAT